MLKGAPLVGGGVCAGLLDAGGVQNDGGGKEVKQQYMDHQCRQSYAGAVHTCLRSPHTSQYGTNPEAVLQCTLQRSLGGHVQSLGGAVPYHLTFIVSPGFIPGGARLAAPELVRDG